MTADGKLIVWGGLGRLSLIETASDRFEELSKTVRILPATAWPHVVLSGGRLYCKDRNGNLKCFTVRG